MSRSNFLFWKEMFHIKEFILNIQHVRIYRCFTLNSHLTEIFASVQLFFEDNIDDAKYCGRLYGLGSGSSQPQNGISSSGQEETNNKHWLSLRVAYALVFKNPTSRFPPQISSDETKLNPRPQLSSRVTVKMDSQWILHWLALFSRFYWVYGHIFRTRF